MAVTLFSPPPCGRHRLTINGKRVAIVISAYTAAKTLELTGAELPDVLDIRILVDDCGHDETVELMRQLSRSLPMFSCSP
jgi:hypothetical protein